MNGDLRQVKKKFQKVTYALQKFLYNSRRVLLDQFNKNIYTRILFTNVIIFIFALIVLGIVSNFVVKQVTYDQVQQDLLRKAKRVNYVLVKENLIWKNPNKDQSAVKQELLRFLADSFDAKITIFDRQGMILSTSAEQEVVPGSKIDAKFLEVLGTGEIQVTRKTDGETGQKVFIAAMPMGDTENPEGSVNNGILLETKTANLELTLNRMNFYLLIGGTGILIIVIIISVNLAMKISRPISRLATSVAEISRGSYALCDEDQPLDEINVLADQLNKLVLRLEAIKAESARMEEEKARLFAEISHELRTPLTAVQGFTEAIRDGMVEDETLRRKYLDMIYTQTLHIARLVDDILALSRLESGEVKVEKFPLDLVALAQGVVMSMEGLAKSKNNSIEFEKKVESAIVLGDGDRMEQILKNLLKNAVAATENGTIKVGIDSQQDEVLLVVEDNGVGISPDDLPHVWDRFYQARKHRNTNLEEKGTGLGLVIVKKLVQLQDGEIEVESELGKGTVFRISFPAFNSN